MKPHVFYDFDGTLGDSLRAHVRFLHDMNSRFDVGLELPAIDDYETCKRLVKTPMREFIKNAGFPDNLTKRVLMMYKQTFAHNSRYRYKLFRGIREVLEGLFDEIFYQSVVSSNFLRNFEPVLEREKVDYILLKKIDRAYLDEHHKGDKAECLTSLSERLKLPYNMFVYVGDTEEDFQAAQKAEVAFVGVGYGWQITPEDTRFPVAKSPKHLQEILKSFSMKHKF
ncbi:hypothetical protein DRN73_06675 [Candidatus Pacearchaeota archaeon]|nr:MAG: hypothetical protein DRN73_06675 [Candidatus Pacearchaeota archaeon]